MSTFIIIVAVMLASFLLGYELSEHNRRYRIRKRKERMRYKSLRRQGRL